MGPTKHFLGQVLQETYRIERLLGQGSMGEVYEASHLRLARRFAIKILSPVVAQNPEALARFKREAEVTSALGHPNIIEVIDFNHTPDDEPYLVMELLEGEDLGARLKRTTLLPLEETVPIITQVTEAMQAAHDKGVVHRDLKPQNIFLCQGKGKGERVKVVDFGISKIIGLPSELTRTHALIGTPYYMSPEQAEERGSEVDLRTDIYALGTILFQMLTGQLPFISQTIPTLLFRIVHEAPPSACTLNPALSPAVDAVLQKALHKNSAARFASMDAFLQAFNLAMAHTDEALISQGGALRSSFPEDIAPFSPLEDSTPTIFSSVGEKTPTGPFVPSAQPLTPTGQSSTLSASLGELNRSGKGKPRRSRIAWLVGLMVVALGGGVYLGLRLTGSPAISPRRAAVGPTSTHAIDGPSIFDSATPLTQRDRDTRPQPGSTGAAVQPRSPLTRPAATVDRGLSKRNMLPTTRALWLDTTPTGAQVWLDHSLLGKTPLRGVDIKNQRATLVCVKKGYRRFTTTLAPGPASLRLDTIRLELLAPLSRKKSTVLRGTLLVQTLNNKTAIAVDVFLDGTPIGQSPLILKDVLVDKHLLEVRRQGFLRQKKWITLRANRSNRFVFEMKRAP